MKKRAILIVGLALAIATAGLVYAHWTDTLTVQGNVNSGSINMGFTAGTDDDGILGNDLEGADVGDVLLTYDRWGASSTADPAGMFRVNSSTGFAGYVYPYGFHRYDKDVAICTAVVGGKTLTINAENTYPSYFCTTFINITNNGTVPVKLQGGTFGVARNAWGPGLIVPGVYANNPVWQSGPAGFMGAYFGNVHELTFDFARGMWCGTQIDPGETVPMVFWFHVEQGTANSSMNRTYTFNWTQDFVNWNEFNAAACPPGSTP
jgi:hypothetical protein